MTPTKDPSKNGRSHPAAPHPAPATNADNRRAIRSKVTDTRELLDNLAALADTGPDSIPTLTWARALDRVERLRAAAFAIVDMIALSGREVNEHARAGKK